MPLCFYCRGENAHTKAGLYRVTPVHPPFMITKAQNLNGQSQSTGKHHTNSSTRLSSSEGSQSLKTWKMSNNK
ncbi:hypothetical protein E2C01_003571 [Portunus trituberculatus]|uniref:Uncharacterized protein n=1 Tax=Portunus trituberculatus TaxID=210409 RepID=A0A5B7CMS3_PORTR|nr:hypothetical protein [Portunus trituberculatus]